MGTPQEPLKPRVDPEAFFRDTTPDYPSMAREAASRYRVDPNIFERQMAHESINYDPDVVAGRRKSPKGAAGIAQFMPETGARYGLRGGDFGDASKSLDAAARHMRDLLDETGDDYEAALAGYNAGIGHVRNNSWRNIPETRNYTNKILGGARAGLKPKVDADTFFGTPSVIKSPVASDNITRESLNPEHPPPLLPIPGGEFDFGKLSLRPRGQFNIPSAGFQHTPAEDIANAKASEQPFVAKPPFTRQRAHQLSLPPRPQAGQFDYAQTREREAARLQREREGEWSVSSVTGKPVPRAPEPSTLPGQPVMPNARFERAMSPGPLTDVVKSFVQGAVGATLDVPGYFNDIAGDTPSTRAVRGVLEDIRSAVATALPIEKPESFWTSQIPQAGGSSVPFMVASALAPEAIASRVVAGLGAAQNGHQVYDEARKAGKTHEEALKASIYGAAIGTTEMFGLGAVRSRMGSMPLLDAIKHEALEEGGQETLQAFLNNATARGFYDPNRPLDRDIIKNAVIGAITGGIMGGGAHAGGEAISRLRGGPISAPGPSAGPVASQAPQATATPDGPISQTRTRNVPSVTHTPLGKPVDPNVVIAEVQNEIGLRTGVLPGPLVAPGAAAPEVAARGETQPLMPEQSPATRKRYPPIDVDIRAGDLEAPPRAPREAPGTIAPPDVSQGQQAPQTLPEPAEAISAQIEALRQGRGSRRAVLVTPGEAMPVSKGALKSEGLAVTKVAGVGTFIHSNNRDDPRYVPIEEIRQRAADGSYHELLGIAEPKSAAATEAVVARDKAGTELQAALASPENVPLQAAELAAQHPGAQVNVETPEDVIAGRLKPNSPQIAESLVPEGAKLIADLGDRIRVKHADGHYQEISKEEPTNARTGTTPILTEAGPSGVSHRGGVRSEGDAEGGGGVDRLRHDAETEEQKARKARTATAEGKAPAAAAAGEEGIVNPIDRSASQAEKVKQLQALSTENEPIVRGIMKRVGEVLGVESKLSHKLPEAILGKANRPSIKAKDPWFDVEHVRDSLRFKSKLNTLEDVGEVAKILAESGIEIVKTDTSKMITPREWGWRFVAFDLRMPNGQLVEYYAPLKELDSKEVKGPNHKLFEKWRNTTDEERLARAAEYEQDLLTSRQGYQDAWDRGIQRLGLTEEAARASWSKVEASLPSTGKKSSLSSSGETVPRDQAPPRRTIATPLAESSTIASPESGLSETTGIEKASTKNIPQTEATSSTPQEPSDADLDAIAGEVIADVEKPAPAPKKYPKEVTDIPTYEARRKELQGKIRSANAADLGAANNAVVRPWQRKLNKLEDDRAEYLEAQRNAPAPAEKPTAKAKQAGFLTRKAYDKKQAEIEKKLKDLKPSSNKRQALQKESETLRNQAMAWAASHTGWADLAEPQKGFQAREATSEEQLTGGRRKTPEVPHPAPAERKAERAKSATAEKTEIRSKRADLIKDWKKKLDPSKLATGVDPEHVAFAVRVLKTYIDEGIVDFKVAARNFQEDFGEGARALDKHLEAAWRKLKEKFYPNISDASSVAELLGPVDIPSKAEQTTGKEKPSEKPLSQPDRAPAPDQGERPGELRGDEQPGTTEGVLEPGAREGVSELSPTAKGRGEPDTGKAAGDRGAHDVAEAGEISPTATAVTPNYVIERPEDIGAGGIKSKFRNNVDAIKTLRKIEAEGRLTTKQVTLAEQQILAKYVGWGGMKGAFNRMSEDAGQWTKERDELQKMQDDGLLSADEFETAFQSTQYAHYTSGPIVQTMWGIAKRLGFKGGRMLESAGGIGNFLGLIPSDIRPRVTISAVEMDKISGAMMSLLYPHADVQIKPFQETAYPDNFFDVALSNFPFSDTVIRSDPRYKADQAVLHDYFFLKTLDKVKPGGLLIAITSMGTLDKVDSSIRRKLARQADLVAAMRLPGKTFAKTADTDVTTDILILRKRKSGEKPSGVAWEKTQAVKDQDSGADIIVNEYFAKNKPQILGRLDLKGSMYGGEEKHVTRTPDFEGRLAKAIERLPEDIFDADKRTQGTAEPERMPAPGDVKPGGLTVRGGKLYQRTENELIEITASSPKAFQRIEGMLKVRDEMRALLAAEEDGSTAPRERKALNTAYDAFVKHHGRLHDAVNQRLFWEDPDAPVLLALERVDTDTEKVTKADIFTRSTSARLVKPLKAADPSSALAVTLNEMGHLDMPRMAELLGKSEEEVGKALVKEGIAFEDPIDGWMPADFYLSGNVKKRLAQAQAAARVEPEKYDANVKALEKVQPADVPYHKIVVKLGSPWVAESDIADFAANLLGATPSDFHVQYSGYTGGWNVAYTHRGSELHEYKDLATKIYGTNRVNFIEILKEAMAGRTIIVKDRVEVNPDRFEINIDDTAKANEKRDLIKQKFKDWIWSDDERRQRLHRLYNDQFNNMRGMKWNGQHLTLPGINPKFLEPGQLSPHHKDDTWRFLTTGRILLGHEVGVGKSFTETIALMEAKRLGIANKPMLAVPKANIFQITETAKMLYPGKRILSTARNFDADKRKRIIAQIATNDWDLVIVSHEHLGMIPVSTDTIRHYINEEIQELEDAMRASLAVDNTKGNRVVRDLAKKKEKLQERLGEILRDKKRDENITWEQLGIDHMIVDEAHIFKSLPVYTTKNRVKGIPTDNSDRASDLHMRLRWLMEKNGGKGIGFATGTPVSNTLVELFNMQKFIQPDELKERGLYAFDAWANTFGESQTKFEYKPTGDYEPVERFSKYGNLPELLSLAHDMMSVRYADEMPWIKRPKRVDRLVTTEMSPRQQRFLQILRYRSEALKRRRGPPLPGEDNILVVMTDARKMSVDVRLVDPLAQDDPTSKTNMVVADVVAKYKANPKVTQLIFSDVGVHPTAWGFSVFDDIITKLVKGGIPQEEILNFSTLTDAQKRTAADKIYSGKAKIGIGSSSVMGQGLNLQKFLKHSHNLDVPYTPAKNEQRDGRIHRQGNSNEEIDIARYVTLKSFDTLMWQTVDRKAAFIKDAMKGGVTQREVEEEDEEELTPAQIFAVASGNPYLIRKIELEHTIAELEASKIRHDSEQLQLKDAIADTTRKIKQSDLQISRMEDDLAQVAKTAEQPFELTFDGTTYADKKSADAALENYHAKRERASAAWLADKKGKGRAEFYDEGGVGKGTGQGEYRGFEIEPSDAASSITLQRNQAYGASYSIQSFDAVLRNIDHHIKKAEQEKAALEDNIAKTKAEIGKPFARSDELKALHAEFRDVADKVAETAEAQKVVVEVLERGSRFMIGEPEKPESTYAAEYLKKVGDAYEKSDDEDFPKAFPFGFGGVKPAAKSETEGNERTKNDYLDAYLRDHGDQIHNSYKFEEGADFLWELVYFGDQGVRAAKSKGNDIRTWETVDDFEKDTGHIIFTKYTGPPKGAKVVDGIIYVKGIQPMEGRRAGKGGLPGPLNAMVIDGKNYHTDGGLMLQGKVPKGSAQGPEIDPAQAAALWLRGEGGVRSRPIAAYKPKFGNPEIWFDNGFGLTATHYDHILSRITTATFKFIEADNLFGIYKGETRVGMVAALKSDTPEMVLNILGQMNAAPQEGQMRERARSAAPAGAAPTVAPLGSDIVDSSARAQLRGALGETRRAALRPTPETEAGAVGAAVPGRAAAPPRAPAPPETYKGFENPEMEERWNAAKGIRPEPLWLRVKEKLAHLKNLATRDLEHLARGAQHAELSAALRELAHGKGIASDEAVRILQGLTAKLKKDSYDLYTRRIILDDLLEESDLQADRHAEAGVGGEEIRLPFGFTPDSVLAESRRLDEALKDQPDVEAAVRQRRAVIKEVTRDYLAAAKNAIGFEPQLTRERYYRHQVIEYANAPRPVSGTGQRVGAPTGRGFLKKRKGSDLDINTSYLQAEHSVLAQMLYDTEVFNLLKLVDENYNQSRSMKNEARQANARAMQEIVDAEDERRRDEPPDIEGPVFLTVGEQMKLFKRKIGRGFAELSGLARHGQLWTGENNEFETAVRKLQATRNYDEDLSDGGSAFKYLAALAANDAAEGNLQARVILKAISQRRAFVKQTLGDDFKTWKHFLPETHSLWQPREGNVLYNTYSLPERLVNQALENAFESIGFEASDLRRAMVMGGKRTEFAIPTEVADTLDHFMKPRDTNPLDQAVRATVRGWKVWQLISPHRLFKYNARNISGDAEAVFVGNPHAFLKVGKATGDLWEYLGRKGAPSPELQDWIERGGLYNLFQVAEDVGSINGLKVFRNLELDKKGNLQKANLAKWYWRKATMATNFREAVLRYAAFVDYREQVLSNPEGRPKNYGASIPEEVNALRDPIDKAFKLSNDLLGAYNEVTVMGQWLRTHLQPFWSWQEVNAKRYYRLLKNAVYESESTADAGRSLLGKGVRVSPFVAFRIGKFMLKAAGLWAMLAAYNNLLWPEEEKDLDEKTRSRVHIILGRRKDGSVIYFDRLGMLGDFLSWFGLDEAPHHVADFLNNKKTAKEIALDMAKAPANKFFQGTGLPKTAAEIATGRNMYPDAFRSRNIRDRWQYLFNSFALGDEYAALAGRPSRGIGRLLRGTFAYEVDPGESAYNQIMSRKSDFNRKRGKTADVAAGNDKSNAAYYTKLALRYGDIEAAKTSLAEYKALGGTPQGLQASIKALAPLSGLNDAEKAEFLKTLTPDERDRMTKAQAFYESVLEKSEDVGPADLLPRPIAKETRAPVDAELHRLGVSFPFPQNEVTIGGKQQQMPQATFDEFQQRMAETFYEQLGDMISKPVYTRMNDADRKLAIDDFKRAWADNERRRLHAELVTGAGARGREKAEAQRDLIKSRVKERELQNKDLLIRRRQNERKLRPRSEIQLEENPQ